MKIQKFKIWVYLILITLSSNQTDHKQNPKSIPELLLELIFL